MVLTRVIPLIFLLDGIGLLVAAAVQVRRTRRFLARALGWGGGIAHFGGELVVNNATITGNEAEAAGGLHCEEAVSGVSNSILAGNRGTRGSPDDCNRFRSLGHNLIGAGCPIDDRRPSDLVGRPPGLGPLRSDGSGTPAHTLLARSPAIDGGSPDAPGDAEAACEPRDQRGRKRAGRCDVGAVEMVPDRE